jgi:ketosteroid isomerase-like protein
MESLRTTFFEDPLYVYVALGFLELVLAAVWWERRSRRWRLSLLAPPLLAAIVFAVEAAVVTHCELIVAAAREIARDVEHGRTDAAEKYLDDTFTGRYEGREIDKKQALASLQAGMKLFGVSSVGLRKMEVQVSGSSATMHAVSLVTIRGAALGGGTASLVWDLVWIKRGGQWQIIELVQVQQKVEF